MVILRRALAAMIYELLNKLPTDEEGNAWRRSYPKARCFRFARWSVILFGGGTDQSME
jgi:hypothetical protein